MPKSFLNETFEAVAYNSAEMVKKGFLCSYETLYCIFFI